MLIDKLKQILELKQSERAISIATMTALPLWHQINGRERDHLDVVTMGLASPMGLGLALARPDRKVIVLEGDGSLLMELGCLATIGRYHPKNLYIFVMDNGVYATTGGQAIPAIKWAQLALSMGIMAARNWIPPYLSNYGPVIYTVESDQLTALPYPPLNLPKEVRTLERELYEDRSTIQSELRSDSRTHQEFGAVRE